MEKHHSVVTWILVTNSVKAEIYRAEHKHYSLYETLEHPQSRLKSGELTSDGAGHYRSGNAVHGKFDPHSDAHEKEHKHFAKELAHYLEENRQQNHYVKLIVCAEPRFHGLLNSELSKSVAQLITQSIEKDYIPLPTQERHHMIEKLLDGATFTSNK